MPQSDPYNIPWILQLIDIIRPQSVLDIGIGNGSYGLLIRQNLDIAKGRLKKDQWITKIDGIEVFENYKNPLWDYFYDSISIGNVLGMKELIAHYDLILLCDVIEHFTKEEGLQLLDQLLEKTNYLIISTPKKNYPQGEVLGNIYETHLSNWDIHDFMNYPNKTITVNQCFISVMSQENKYMEIIDMNSIPHLIRPSNHSHGIVMKSLTKLIFKLRHFFQKGKKEDHN